MARQSFKRWLPASLERSIYVAASGIVVGGLALGWQSMPGEPTWQGPVWVELISLIALAGAGTSCMGFDHLTFLGIRAAWTGAPITSGPLRVVGPYRYVRHPLMLGLLIALWAQPRMPVELLMLNAGLTLYIAIAIRLEERDLIRQHGREYEQYRLEVPSLIPFMTGIRK